jgi:Tfp pilus assembly protein PilF
LLTAPELDGKKVIMQINDKEQKEFPLKAAALNIRGLVKRDQGDESGAKKDFQAALEVAPDFIFATENLAKPKK